MQAKSQLVTDAVDYSFKRGFYTNEFQLTLSTKTHDATIRYTTDGSKPTSNSAEYTEPLTISTTTMVRTVATHPAIEDSKIKTHTFIFPHNIVRTNDSELKLYPNPVSNILRLSEEKEYRIFSSTGEYISSGKSSEVKMSDFPNGLYIVLIDNEFHKIIKI
ncbi:MAG: chitobiase/beta-hexosaminidase C-terminal domain-containing protein [Prolixibacteraceae bacterium]|nr:chitobiase/beta-hexosaminidase C-terminal domain-containing protein [Prolixibacteraceae bacterium]